MKLFVDGEEFDLEPPQGKVIWAGDRLMVTTAEGTRSALAIQTGNATLVSFRGRQFTVAKTRSRTPSAAQAGDGTIRAPMPGQIVDVRTVQGATVSRGQVLVVLEAMKTQQPFTAPFDGSVETLPVALGEQVAEGAILVRVVSSASG